MVYACLEPQLMHLNPSMAADLGRPGTNDLMMHFLAQQFSRHVQPSQPSLWAVKDGIMSRQQAAGDQLRVVYMQLEA